MHSTFAPIKPDERTQVVDVVRAIALLGVVVMNYQFFFDLGGERKIVLPAALGFSLQTATGLTWMTLSLLFGYGFAAGMEKTALSNKSSLIFYARKMFWLLVFAVVNSAFFFGDILKDYAILGMFLLFVRHLSPKWLLLVLLLLFILLPFIQHLAYKVSMGTIHTGFADLLPLYKSGRIADVLKFGLLGTWLRQVTSVTFAITVHAVMFCCFLLGLLACKTKFFNDLKQNKTLLNGVLLISGVTCLIFSNLFHFRQGFGKPVIRFYIPDYRFLLGAVVFAVTAICRLYEGGKFNRLFSFLQFTGRMTLSNYLLQNMLSVLLFSGAGFGLVNRLPLWCYLVVALLVFIVQAFISRWWLGRYNFGPAEWLWRRLSYGIRLPLKKPEVV